MRHRKFGAIVVSLTDAVYAAPLLVVTSFSALDDVTKQAGGEHIVVQSLAGTNQGTHVYHMISGDIEKIHGVKLALLNGLGLEIADVRHAVKQNKVPFTEATRGI